MKKLLLVGLFALALTGSAGLWAVQDSQKAYCVPTHIDPQGERCHCLAMGGYRNCRGGHYIYGLWSGNEEGGETKSPKCEMSCTEEKCMCCKAHDDATKGK